MRGRDDASQPAEAWHQVQCTAGVVRPGRCCDEALDDTMTSGQIAYVCRSGVVCVLCLTDIGECEAETCQNEGMRTSPTPTPTQLTKTESPSVSSQTPLPAPTRPDEGNSCEHDVDGRGALPCMDGDCTFVQLLCRLKWSQLRYHHWRTPHRGAHLRRYEHRRQHLHRRDSVHERCPVSG